MVAQNTVRTYGYIRRVVNSEKEISEKTCFTLYVQIIFWATILYKYHGYFLECQDFLDIEYELINGVGRFIELLVYFCYYIP